MPDRAKIRQSRDQIANQGKPAVGSPIYRYMWARFETFCDSPEEASEEDVLCFLWAHREDWGHGTHRAAVNAINARFHTLGRPSPCGARTYDLLARLRSVDGLRLEEPVDAVRLSDAFAMVKRLAERVEPALVHRQRAVLAVMRAVGHTLTGGDLRELDTAAIALEGEDVIIFDRVGNRVGVLSGRSEPRGARELRAALWTYLSGRPLSKLPRTEDVAGLQAAWVRAFGSQPLGPLPREVACLDSASFGWLSDCIDHRVPANLMWSAYVLVGVPLARRHEEMRTYDLSSTRENADGIWLHAERTKTDPNGETGQSKFLPHVEGLPGWDLCPACMLSRHLRACRMQGRTIGPVFAIHRSGAWIAPSTHGASLMLKTLWRNAGLDADRRISSRSVRVGGATTASEAGLSIIEIATGITNHQSFDVAERYVRRADPHALPGALAL